MTSFPDHPFWDFSLKVYGSEGVAPACLKLQETHGIDVNFLLFCGWLGVSGRGVATQSEVAQMSASVSAWHGEIVRGLRAMRKRLKEPLGAEDRDLALTLRKRVQKAEIDAEHIEQLMLAAAADGLPERKPGDRAESARANANTYVALIKARLDEGDRVALETIIAAAVGSPPDRD